VACFFGGQARAFQRLRVLCAEVLFALPTSAAADAGELVAAEAAHQECLCLAITWRMKYKQ